MERHSVDIVDIPMFPITMVDVVLWHGSFWPVENRRLVHVIPEPEIRGRSNKFVEFEE